MKPQDVLVCIRLFLWKDERWTYVRLADSLKISASETHAAVRRLNKSFLFDPLTQSIRVKAFEEFIIHAIKYLFPSEIGPLARGVRTAHSAPIFTNEMVYSKDGDTYVWPYPMGKDRGISVTPLYRTVPIIALNDHLFYDWISATDVLRLGRARDREVAIRIIKKMISNR